MKPPECRSHAFAAVIAAMALGACGQAKVIFGAPSWQHDPPPHASLRGRIVTTNNGDDTLSVVDPASGSVVASLPVGLIPVELEGPHHLAVAPDGSRLFFNLSNAVANSGSGPHGTHGTGTVPGLLMRMRTADATVDASVQVDPNPGEVALSPDGTRVYVTHYDLRAWLRGALAGDLRKGDSNLVVVDAERMQVLHRVPICPAAHGVRVSDDGRQVFAVCGPDEIAVVDVSGEPVVTRVPLPGLSEQPTCAACPYGLGVAPDGSVWVSTLGPQSGVNGGGTLQVYDPKTEGFRAAWTRAFGGRALFAAFHGTSESYVAWVPEQGAAGDRLHVYDVTAGAMTEREVIDLPRADCINAHMLEISGDGLRGWLICEGDHVGPGTFVTLDLTGASPPFSTPVGVFPDGLALVPPTTDLLP
jgi:YVTN family beta-propeller protein